MSDFIESPHGQYVTFAKTDEGKCAALRWLADNAPSGWMVDARPIYAYPTPPAPLPSTDPDSRSIASFQTVGELADRVVAIALARLEAKR